VNYWLHPEAAAEHKRQVAYYDDAQRGLGRRYHSDFVVAMSRICAAPRQSRIAKPPDIRRAILSIFHFDVIYREVDGAVQVLAVAHHRRQPGYWAVRL
jgi:toxin ParE1/3/4